MYVVFNKTDHSIVHINRAPLSQKLKENSVYIHFNSDDHYIGKTDESVLPEYFRIVDQKIKEKTIEEKVEDEDIILSKYEYIREGEITKKTIEELVLDGVATGLVHKLDDIKRLQFKINRVASMINNLRHKYIVLNQERWRVKLVKISRIYHKQIKKITDNYTNKDILELEELKINNII